MRAPNLKRVFFHLCTLHFQTCEKQKLNERKFIILKFCCTLYIYHSKRNMKKQTIYQKIYDSRQILCRADSISVHNVCLSLPCASWTLHNNGYKIGLFFTLCISSLLTSYFFWKMLTSIAIYMNDVKLL